jgi:RimJ/RimL family protein N-acetyltransferase
MQDQDPTLTADLRHWRAPVKPSKQIHQGRYCCLEPLNRGQHAQQLWQAFVEDKTQSLWQYLPYGPFKNVEDFSLFIEEKQNSTDAIFFALVSRSTKEPLGFVAYSRIQPEAGSIEVAHVCFSPSLQKTTLATEALFLLLDHCFSLGYRRCEWKCNALNSNSKKAAQRFGFQFEGHFRQATVVKGRNRDTDWYSIIDKEWPPLKSAYQLWLDPNNFDESNFQIRSLQTFLQHKC